MSAWCHYSVGAEIALIMTGSYAVSLSLRRTSISFVEADVHRILSTGTVGSFVFPGCLQPTLQCKLRRRDNYRARLIEVVPRRAWRRGWRFALVLCSAAVSLDIFDNSSHLRRAFDRDRRPAFM